MPYKIEKRGRIYFLKKKDSNKIISRHTSRAKAQAAIRAIEANKHGGKE
jgi:hypothetical protein